MSDLERRRAQHEAAETAPRRSSADRARLWASLNKYLASEARRAHRVAEEERDRGREEPGRRPDRG